MYASTFQELFYSADRVHGGSLPVPVHFLMDEFANVSLPDDLNLFESAYREVCEKIRIELLEPPKARRATTQASLGVGVNAAKAEKSDGWYMVKPCVLFSMGNQQLSP